MGLLSAQAPAPSKPQAVPLHTLITNSLCPYSERLQMHVHPASDTGPKLNVTMYMSIGCLGTHLLESRGHVHNSFIS